MDQNRKGALFRDLHTAGRPFLIANPWDAGSARILEKLGYVALATSSGAFAGTRGEVDGSVTRDEMLARSEAIVSSTDLPVSADLEAGFGDSPETVAQTIRLAAQAGLVGGSIEDARDHATAPYDIGHACDRIRAASEAARSLPYAFTLTARAENFVRGRFDLDDTIRRLAAYAEAGADVLFAPGLPDLESVKAVCASVDKPVNFMGGIAGRSFTVQALAEAGVTRISLGTSLYRASLQGLMRAAREALDAGTMDYADVIPSSKELAELMK